MTIELSEENCENVGIFPDTFSDYLPECHSPSRDHFSLVAGYELSQKQKYNRAERVDPEIHKRLEICKGIAIPECDLQENEGENLRRQRWQGRRKVCSGISQGGWICQNNTDPIFAHCHFWTWLQSGVE